MLLGIKKINTQTLAAVELLAENEEIQPLKKYREQLIDELSKLFDASTLLGIEALRVLSTLMNEEENDGGDIVVFLGQGSGGADGGIAEVASGADVSATDVNVTENDITVSATDVVATAPDATITQAVDVDQLRVIVSTQPHRLDGSCSLMTAQLPSILKCLFAVSATTYLKLRPVEGDGYCLFGSLIFGTNIILKNAEMRRDMSELLQQYLEPYAGIFGYKAQYAGDIYGTQEHFKAIAVILDSNIIVAGIDVKFRIVDQPSNVNETLQSLVLSSPPSDEDKVALPDASYIIFPNGDVIPSSSYGEFGANYLIGRLGTKPRVHIIHQSRDYSTNQDNSQLDHFDCYLPVNREANTISMVGDEFLADPYLLFELMFLSVRYMSHKCPRTGKHSGNIMNILQSLRAHHVGNGGIPFTMPNVHQIWDENRGLPKNT